MGEIDMVLNRYFEDGERYADLINGYAFNGDQVVRKEEEVYKRQDLRREGGQCQGAGLLLREPAAERLDRPVEPYD